MNKSKKSLILKYGSALFSLILICIVLILFVPIHFNVFEEIEIYNPNMIIIDIIIITIIISIFYIIIKIRNLILKLKGNKKEVIIIENR